MKSPNGINLQKIQFLFGFLLFSATLSPSAPNTGTLLSGALSTLSLCILPLACIGCVVQWLDTANLCPGHHLTESRPPAQGFGPLTFTDVAGLSIASEKVFTNFRHIERACP